MRVVVVVGDAGLDAGRGPSSSDQILADLQKLSKVFLTSLRGAPPVPAGGTNPQEGEFIYEHDRQGAGHQRDSAQV